MISKTAIIATIIVAASGTLSAAQTPQEPVDSFPLPAIPAGLVSPSSRAEYVVTHFFDQAILPDETTPGLEQALANYSTVAHLASDSARTAAVRTLFDRAANQRQREALAEAAEIYFFSPGSPFFNLDLFIPFLEASAPSLRRDEMLRLTAANCAGSVAADIPLITDSGDKTTLKSVAVKSAKTILFFFDPGCDLCHSLGEQLSADIALSAAVKSGRISVVAVSPGLETAERPDFIPQTWIAATDVDGTIEAEDLYYLPSMPDVYIIDSDGKVIARNLRHADEILKTLGL